MQSNPDQGGGNHRQQRLRFAPDRPLVSIITDGQSIFGRLVPIIFCESRTKPAHPASLPKKKRKMALSESSQLLGPPSPAESVPAPRRTALPSRPMGSKDAGEPTQPLAHQPALPEDQEQTGSDAGPSPTLTRASAVSPAPPSPTQYKAGSPSSQGKTQAGSGQGNMGQVCR